MTGTKRRRAILSLALCAVLLALCWGLGLGRGEIALSGFQWKGLSFYRDGGKSFSLADGDAHGVLNGGPGFTLPAGRYKLKITVASDGDNAVHIVTGNNARVQPAELLIPAQSWNNTLSFELLEDARDLELQIDFMQGEYLQIHDASLVMCDVTDGTWTLTLLALLACGLYLSVCCGVLTRESLGRLLLLGAAVLAACVPVLRDQLYGGHDTLFHQMRVYNVADALACGQFPVRMGGYGYRGYGSAVSIFYPDVFLLLPALMLRTGATVQAAMRVYIIVMNELSAATMYVCGRRMLRSEAAGTCASILYTLANYRLIDLYVRDALGEYTAMAMLPLFLLGLWEVLFGDAKRWRTLTLGATLVFMSHMLTTVLCAVLAALAFVLCLGRIVREKRFLPILKAAVSTVLLNLFLLVPMLDYSAQGIGDSGTLMTSCAGGAMQLMELFAVQDYRIMGLGGMLLLSLAALLYAGITGHGERAPMQAALLLALAGILSALAATNLFPWALAERLTRGLINYLQFPFRLLTFATLFLALAGGYGIVCFAGGRTQRELAMLLTLVLCVMGVSAQIHEYAVQDHRADVEGFDRNCDPYIRYKSYTDVIASSYLEYALPGASLTETRKQSPEIDGEAELDAYRKDGTTITAQVHAQTDAQITLPLFGFDGYRATLDGKRLETGTGDNRRMTVALPAGAQGALRVWFAGKPIWRIAEAVSLATLAALLLRRRAARRINRLHM